MIDKVVFTTPWFDIVTTQLADEKLPYYIVRPPDYVTIFAKNTRDEVILVEQFRPVVGETTIEFPSGHVEQGEDPKGAAIRELFEETGYRAKDLELIGKLIPDIGRTQNTLWVFYSEDVPRESENYQEKKSIFVKHFTTQETVKMICEGKIPHALDLAVLCMYQIKKSGWVK